MARQKHHHPLAVLLLRAVVCGVCTSLLASACGGPDEPTVPEFNLGQITTFPVDSTQHDISDLTVSPDGEVWVISTFEPFVHRYSPDGRVIGRFGRKGAGPGELELPWSIEVEEQGDSVRVHVWDIGRRLIDVFDGQGTLLAIHSPPMSVHFVVFGIEKTAFGTPRKLARLGSGYVLQDQTSRVVFPVDLVNSVLLKLDSTGAVVDTIVDYQDRFAEGIQNLNQARALVAVPLWTTCRDDGRLALLDPYEPAIEWFDTRGRRVGSELLALPELQVQGSDVEAWARQSILTELGERGRTTDEAQINQQVDRLTQNRAVFGRRAPPAVDLVCGPHDALWLETFSTRDSPVGYGRSWLVVTTGKVRARVTFPPGFRPRFIGPSTVFGVHTDDMGVSRVAVVRLSLALTTLLAQ